MSHKDHDPSREVKAEVRLRRADRLQMRMVVRCDDDRVSADHPVRTVWALVQTMDLSGFCEPIKAREGLVGRDGPGAAGEPVALRRHPRRGVGAGVGSALP